MSAPLNNRPNKRTRKQVRSDRLWKHWLSWLGEPFGPDLKRIEGYNPEAYRAAFERFQTHGKAGLTADELYGIHPLIAAQKAKEVTLTSMAQESMEFWSKGLGWDVPWKHTCRTRKIDNPPMDRLTYAAILRTRKAIEQNPFAFFMRHPGIPEQMKQRYLAYRIACLN